MKTILYVFSGTGNTLKVAALYKKYLESYDGNSVDIYRISTKSGEIPDPSGYDLVGLGYPIHGFSAPEPAINFCNKLPEVENKRTFIFKSSGEGLHINDCSSQKCIKILEKKGYDVVMERHIVMPYNMIYRHRDEMAKQMWIYAHALVDLNCKEITEGKRENVKQPFYKTFYCPVVRFLEQKFAHIHGPAFKVDADKCVRCNKCVNVCPQGNIKITDGKYTFGHDCVLCMGCSFGCPQDAISVGVFKFWKVNGSYRLNELARDQSIPFPFTPSGEARGIYRLYKSYYRNADRLLCAAGLDINDYI